MSSNQSGVLSLPKAISEREAQTLLHRVASRDRSAAAECIELYGGTVWTMANACSKTQEEAETAAEAIFLKIWETAGTCTGDEDEPAFVRSVAARYLFQRALGQV